MLYKKQLFYKVNWRVSPREAYNLRAAITFSQENSNLIKIVIKVNGYS